MFQQNISTDDSTYYNHFTKNDPWEGGKGGSRFRLSLRAGSVNGYVVTGRLKNLGATISEGKYKNFPE